MQGSVIVAFALKRTFIITLFDVIITSWMAISELVDYDNYNVLPLVIPLEILLKCTSSLYILKSRATS